MRLSDHKEVCTATVDLRKEKVTETTEQANGGKTVEVKSMKDIPEKYRKEFVMRMLVIKAFVNARNAMWNNLSKASPNGRVKYI